MIDDPLNRLKVKRGSQLPWAKLNEDDVRLILEMKDRHKRELERLMATSSNKALAEKFGVHYRTIERITEGRGWTHVEYQ